MPCKCINVGIIKIKKEFYIELVISDYPKYPADLFLQLYWSSLAFFHPVHYSLVLDFAFYENTAYNVFGEVCVRILTICKIRTKM